MHKVVRGLVLREVKFKEADKLLTVLTREEGKLTIRARDALRKNSRYGAAAQLLSFSELTLFCHKGRWSLNEGSTVEQFLGLRDELPLLSLATYFAELLEAVSDEDSPSPAALNLGLNALFALSRRLYPPAHIKAVFELRLMSLVGFLPSLDACGQCGAAMPAQPRFLTLEGVLACAACALEGASLSLCPASLAAMRHVTHAAPKKVFSFTLDEDAQKRFYAVCEAYVRVQLDRSFHSLDYWKQLR